jgi:hypothetical protein
MMTILSVVFAGLSALLWLAAAFVKLPTTVWLQFGVGGGRPSPEMDKVLTRLRLQSGLNAAAAFCMSISVVFQLIALRSTLG